MGQCAVIYKCCPDGFKLSEDVFEDGNLASSTQYFCAEDKNGEFQSKISNQTFDFNVQKSNESKIPICSDPNFLIHEILDNMLVLYSESCVDFLDNKFHVFSCGEQEALESVNIYKMQKCCPVDHSYDIFERKCVINSDDPSVNNYTYITVTIFHFQEIRRII